MQLTIDITAKTFRVSRGPEPKTDNQGEQRIDKATGEPKWLTQCFVQDVDGGEVITITTVGPKPDVTVGDMITPVCLEAIPWHTNGRSGVAFTARYIEAA